MRFAKTSLFIATIMAAPSATSTLLKLARLNTSSDYIYWKRHMYSFIAREDPMLESVSVTTNDPELLSEWNNNSAKMNSTIILALGDSFLENLAQSSMMTINQQSNYGTSGNASLQNRALKPLLTFKTSSTIFSLMKKVPGRSYFCSCLSSTN